MTTRQLREAFNEQEISAFNYMGYNEKEARLVLGEEVCDNALLHAFNIYSENLVPPSASKEQQFIKDFVSTFLTPYITDQIQEETDDKNRMPMIEQLKENYFQFLDENAIEEYALDAFIEKATDGLYIYAMRGGLRFYQDRYAPNRMRHPDDTYALIKSLEKALPREFPNKTIEGLRDRVGRALEVVNEERGRLWYYPPVKR